MGVFKEEAFTFEDVAKRQKQIWNDACDYGMPYNTGNVPKEISALLASIITFQELDKKYPNEKRFIRKRDEWFVNKEMKGVTIVIRIGWELEDRMEYGTEYTITYCFIGNKDKHPSFLCHGCNAFISVDAIRYTELK
jgi:hypothetical protein